MAARKKYKFKNGDKVKLVGASTNHGPGLGLTLTIQGPSGNGFYKTLEYPNYQFSVNDLAPLASKFTKKELEKEKKKLQEEIALLDNKMAYLDETGQDIGSDREFRVYQTLTFVEDGNLTKKEKAVAIARLLEDND